MGKIVTEITDLWDHDIPGYEQSQEKPTLSLYLLDNDRTNPAIIICPGGGYGHRADHEGEPVALWLNRLGISAIVLNYRISPVMHPYPIADAIRSIKTAAYQYKNWNIDSQRIGLLGFSAGGHLAASAANHLNIKFTDHDDPVDKTEVVLNLLVLCYPVISFVNHVHEGSMTNLIGRTPGEEIKRFLSNELNITKTNPPTFIWHTYEDVTVAVENTLMYIDALRKNNIPFESHIFTKGGHGLGIKDDVPDVKMWMTLCENWFKSRGFIS